MFSQKIPKQQQMLSLTNGDHLETATDHWMIFMEKIEFDDENWCDKRNEKIE